MHLLSYCDFVKTGENHDYNFKISCKGTQWNFYTEYYIPDAQSSNKEIGLRQMLIVMAKTGNL